MRIWSCLAHILDGDAKKLEPRSKLCIFIGYPKGTKRGLFYNSKEKKKCLPWVKKLSSYTNQANPNSATSCLRLTRKTAKGDTSLILATMQIIQINGWLGQ